MRAIVLNIFSLKRGNKCYHVPKLKVDELRYHFASTSYKYSSQKAMTDRCVISDACNYFISAIP